MGLLAFCFEIGNQRLNAKVDARQIARGIRDRAGQFIACQFDQQAKGHRTAANDRRDEPASRQKRDRRLGTGSA